MGITIARTSLSLSAAALAMVIGPALGVAGEQEGQPDATLDVTQQMSGETDPELTLDTSRSTATDSQLSSMLRPQSLVVSTPGWRLDSGAWRYSDEAGVDIRDQWLNDRGKWYFMDTDGVMVTGWLQLGDKWFFLGSSGARQSGWLKIGVAVRVWFRPF